MLNNFSQEYSRLDRHQQLQLSGELIKEMCQDPRFQPFYLQLQELKHHYSEWESAAREARSGGKMNTRKMIEKGITVDKGLKHLFAELEIIQQEWITNRRSSRLKNARRKVMVGADRKTPPFNEATNRLSTKKMIFASLR